MKKFYAFLFAAVALVGFAACNSDSTEEPAPAGVEKVSFTANIDNTRTDLDANNKTTWENDDVIKIGKFSFTTTDGVKFSCTEQGCSALLNEEEVEAVYSHNGDGMIDSKAGKAGSVLKAKGKLTADGDEFDFAVTSAFLHIKATGAVTLSADKNIFYYDGAEHNEIAFTEGTDYYVAINPTENVEFSYTVGEETKTKTVAKFEACKIYALDAQEYTTTYLIPNDDWKSDDAWFAAYYYNSGEDYKWVEATDADADGVYECKTVGTYAGVTFCRVNPNFTMDTIRWNQDADGDNKPIWNEAAGNTIPTDKYFYITNWAAGLWLNAAGAEIPTFKVYVIAQPGTDAAAWEAVNIHAFILDGDAFTEWPGKDITNNKEEFAGYTYNVYEFPANASGSNVSIVVNNGSDQTADINLGKLTSNYYVLFSKENNLSSFEKATDAFAAGSIKEYEVPENLDPKPETTTLYLKTDWGWSDWALYAWGGSGTWGTFSLWPGKAKEYDQEIEGETYKAWDIPASCVGQTGTQVIVTGKESDATKQTKDTPVTFTNGKDVFVEITGWDEDAGKAIMDVINGPY